MRLPDRGVKVTILPGTGTGTGAVYGLAAADGIAILPAANAPGSTFGVTAADGIGLLDNPDGFAPWFEEDFSTYVDTADLKNNPRGCYTDKFLGDGNESSNTSRISLLTGQVDGYSGLTKYMRYAYPIINQSDYTISCNLKLPQASIAEIWIEAVTRHSATFTTQGPASGNPDYKFIFGRVNVSGRFNLMLGTGAGAYTFGYPAHEDDFEGGPGTESFDGTWRVHRFHFRVGTGGTAVYSNNGIVRKDYGTVNMASNQIYGMKVGANMNRGTSQVMTIDWGRIRFYKVNPGWGI